jgi:hypothetical protein
MLGPNFACRASVAVSTIGPCCFSTNKTSLVTGIGTTKANRIRWDSEGAGNGSSAKWEDHLARGVQSRAYHKHAVDPERAERADNPGFRFLEQLGAVWIRA